MDFPFKQTINLTLLQDSLNETSQIPCSNLMHNNFDNVR